MFSLTNLLLLICLALLVALHLRLSRWRDKPLSEDGIFLQIPKSNGLPRSNSAETAQEINIHILNPLEVAEKESAFGRVLGKLSPNLISRQVYLKTAETIGHEFRKRGIRARIEVSNKETD